jgi:hypothetical protein
MEASESSAAVAAQRVQAIVEAAEATAREIEENARSEAAALVAQAKGSVGDLVERAESMRRQMDEMTGAIAGLRAAVDAMAAEAAAAASTRANAANPEPVPADPEPEPEPALADPEPALADPAPVDPAPAVKAPEGARLIALNMALSGKPRDETARYLRENFKLDDEDTLLDEVYLKAGS